MLHIWTAGVRLLLLEALSPFDYSAGKENNSQNDDRKTAHDTTNYCARIIRLG